MTQPISPYVLPGVEFDKLSARQRNLLKKIYPASVLSKIEKLVCEYYEVTPMLIRTKRRDRHIVWPRHVYYFLCYQNTNFSMEVIGNRIGIIDHTTVRNGMLTVKNMISTNPDLKNQLLQLQNQVTNVIS